MRVLLLTTRFPAVDGKGDQVRLYSWLSYLRDRHEITVLSSDGAPSPERALAAAASGIGGRPLQVGWMMPGRTWREARRRARTVDVVLAMTVRAVRGRLPTPMVVDHVDSLSLNMRRRADGPESAPVRALARYESAALRRWEVRVAGWAQAQIVSAEEDADSLSGPAPVHVIPHASLSPPHSLNGVKRDIDVIFTGNMRYPPNRAGALYLTQQIAPALCSKRPSATIAVVGRDADALPRTDGVLVASDVQSLAPYLKRAKVAVVPIELGTGIPYKALDAVACGAAVVATPQAARALPFTPSVASTPAEFAEAILRLIDDPSRREREVLRAREEMTALSAERLAARIEKVLQWAATG